MSEHPNPSIFWRQFSRAIGARPLDITVLKGASGLEHTAVCVGVDESRHRLIFVSDLPDPRSAILSRGDLQAAFDSFHIIVARIIPVNYARDALHVLEPIASDRGIIKDPDILSNLFLPAIETLTRLRRLDVLPQETLDYFSSGISAFGKATTAKAPKSDERSPSKESNDLLNRLREHDPLAEDLKYGICPLPLYEFSEEEIGVVSSAKDIHAMQEVLRQRDILQYFFPSPDHLALGLIEHGLSIKGGLLTELRKVPREGHPYGKSEITHSRTLLKTIDELQERGYIAEGESELKVSDKGITIREKMKYRPKEGLISKIINRFNVKIDLKSVFHIGQ